MQALPLQIWAPAFTRKFDALPTKVQTAVQLKIDEMARRVAEFHHERLQGRPEFKLRVGNYRVLYAFDLTKGQIYLLSIGHRRDIYKR